MCFWISCGVRGKGCEKFIADLKLTIIERMFGHEVFGELDFFGRVHIGVFFRGDSRVVGGVVGNVHHKWLLWNRGF